MAQNENEARVAQAIADLAAGMPADDFLQGAAEGLGMVIALLADNPKHCAQFGSVLGNNATGHACTYFIHNQQHQ